MSIDLKRILKDRLEAVAPEYGLHEVLYTSFTRSYGYRGLVSASDVVHAVAGLLEAAPEVLVALGHRSEWVAEETLSAGSAQGSTSWWHNNFFRACDSLDSGGGEDDQLQRGLKQCMKIQQALQVIITLSTCRVATLKDGPNLSIFWDPLTLGKLAQFLVHPIRTTGLCHATAGWYGSSRRVVNRPMTSCDCRAKGRDADICGDRRVHGSPLIGEVIPNKFGTVFEKISYNEKIPVQQLGFDKSVIEIDRDDLRRS
ncbi:MAG: CDC45 family [Benniella sp.]|nr:MAG: CDC45 family [Benniella sp.]